MFDSYARLHFPTSNAGYRRAIPAFLLLIAAVATACGGNSPNLGVNPTAEGAALIDLPGDEGAHDAGIEWWYFNGHLQDELNRGYSFHFVTFQSAGDGNLTGQLLQLGWADHDANIFQTSERVNLVAPERLDGSFSFQSADWRMSGDGSKYFLAFDTEDYTVELQATSLKPPVLHQGAGLVTLGPAGETLYYTRPRLAVSGTVIVGDRTLQVSGIAWMDHQWGEVSSQPVGWDWMSLQLDSGEELMAALVWDPGERQPFTSYGTFVNRGGEAQHLVEGEIELKPLAKWTSPSTGTEYPMGWELNVATLGFSVELIPALEFAEVPKSRFGLPAYWEGAVAVKGTLRGSETVGKGFVELVGYGDR